MEQGFSAMFFERDGERFYYVLSKNLARKKFEIYKVFDCGKQISPYMSTIPLKEKVETDWYFRDATRIFDIDKFLAV